jgi:hypothetical protein
MFLPIIDQAIFVKSDFFKAWSMGQIEAETQVEVKENARHFELVEKSLRSTRTDV